MNMINKFSQAKTKTQRNTLVKRSLMALEKLVSSPETKDLIDKISIAKLYEDYNSTHTRELYLTKSGLKEKKCCEGHLCFDMCGEREYTKCDYEHQHPRKISTSSFKTIINDYELTPLEINTIHNSLKT